MSTMRTIEQAANLYKERDAQTAITQWFIRQLVVSGKVPSVKAGKKYLIALDKLDAYLKCEA
jgi:excisionase family DNA binding protein